MASENSMPIHVAAAVGQKSEVVRLCMDSELVNTANSLGWTPVMYAAYYGHMDVVQALLSLGADVSIRNKFGGCIYTLAAVSGNVEIVRALHIHHKIPAEKLVTTLSVAVLFGHLSLVRFLIDNGADLNAPMNHSGVVPLMLAVIENHVEIVKIMVLRGADIVSQNLAGYSALQLAMIIGNETIISIFNEKLGNSIEPVSNYSTCKNKEAVVQAAISGDLFSLKNLLSHNPSLSTSQHWITNHKGENLSRLGDDDVFMSFDDEKYNVKQSNTFCHHTFPAFDSRNNRVGRSDLFGLCYSPYTSSFHYESYENINHKFNNFKCVSVNAEINFSTQNVSGSEYYLSVASPVKSEGPQKLGKCLKKEVHANLPSNASELVMTVVNKRQEKVVVASPLILACFNGHVETARLLIAAGADPNRQRKGRTPLMVAAITSNMELVGLLLSAGADPLVESHVDSLTAFEIASLSGAHTEVLRLLASYTMPIFLDNSHSTKSPLYLDAPLQLENWISPHRIQRKQQSLASPRFQNNIYCKESPCFSDYRKSKKWTSSPLQKFRKSWQMKTRRLFSTPTSCISTGSGLKVKDFQQWAHAFSKSQKSISDLCFNYNLAQMPFDTPFELLASDKISTVKPPVFIQCSEFNIIEEIKHEKNKLKLEKPSSLNQKEKSTKDSKSPNLLPPEFSFIITSEVPLPTMKVIHHSPTEERNTFISQKTKNATEIEGSFEEYIKKYDLMEYTSLFQRNEVADIEIILSITEDDLKGMGVICAEERRNIFNKIHGHLS